MILSHNICIKKKRRRQERKKKKIYLSSQNLLCQPAKVTSPSGRARSITPPRAPPAALPPPPAERPKPRGGTPPKRPKVIFLTFFPFFSLGFAVGPLPRLPPAAAGSPRRAHGAPCWPRGAAQPARGAATHACPRRFPSSCALSAFPDRPPAAFLSPHPPPP